MNPQQPPYGQQPYPQQPPPQPQPYYGPYPGQQQWYPQGPPPKRRGLGWPVAILLIVAIVAAGGVFGYLKLVGHNGDGGTQGGKPAPVATGAGGQLEVAGTPVYNACNLLNHADVSNVFGRLGDGAYVLARYNDPAALPKQSQDGGQPSWVYGLESECTVQAGDDAPVQSVAVQVNQSVDTGSIDTSYADALDKQQHAPFSKDGSVEKAVSQRYGALVWKTSNALFQINVTAAYQKQLPGDDQLARLLTAVKSRIASPDPNPSKVAITIGAYKVRDVCALWTADDFVTTLKTPADPTAIEQQYPVSPTDYGYESSCQRNNASSSSDVPAPAGTQYIQGGIDPEITVQDYADPATADKQYKDALSQGQFSAIGGLGGPASFGIYANAYEIVVRKDRTVLTVRLGSTVGTADYTPATMQGILTPVARLILGRL